MSAARRFRNSCSITGGQEAMPVLRLVIRIHSCEPLSSPITHDDAETVGVSATSRPGIARVRRQAPIRADAAGTLGLAQPPPNFSRQTCPSEDGCPPPRQP